MWSSFVQWTSRTEPATPLALVRIAFGLTTVLMLLDIVNRGLVEVMWLDKPYGGVRDLGEGNWLVAALGGPTPDVIWPLLYTAIGCGVLMTLGLGGRWSVLGTLLATAAVTDVNSQAGGSYDELLENGLWLVFLGPSTATLSLDCRLRTGAWSDDTPRWALPRYLLLFQLVLMYCTTGMQKLSVHWVPGGEFSALYYIFQQPTWHRFDMRWVAWFYPFTQIGTAVSWFWEVFSPLWLLSMWYRLTRTRAGWVRAWFNANDVRLWYAAIGAVFHAALLVFMDVGPFSPISLAYYFALFDHAELRRLVVGRGRELTPTGASPPR